MAIHWLMDMLLSGKLISFAIDGKLISSVSKHLFIPNFANVDCGYTEITEENKPLIESGYDARTEKELAVLVQYIDRNRLPPPKATFLDIILYSREQIIKENQAMGSTVSSLFFFFDSFFISFLTPFPIISSNSPQIVMLPGESSV
jgi:hypothetical protein